MARTLLKIKGRRESGQFVILPGNVTGSPQYAALSFPARSLLVDLLAQYRGNNNGDYSAAWKLMAQRGWRSRDTLRRALAELLQAGFIVKTRQGGRNIPCLYAVSWKGIDECGGKLDMKANPVPLNTWKQINSLTRLPCQLNTPAVSKQVSANG